MHSPNASQNPSGHSPTLDRPDPERLARSVLPLTNQDPEHLILHPYGVGIDTHSRFIQVCVLYRDAAVIRRAEKSFPTDWPSLAAAREWTLKILVGLAEPDTLRYCIESTATYHLPVIRAFAGIPTVVNPLLAGATKRKTDVLDAQLLAHHSITGLWKSSFIPSQQSQELRVLWAQRHEHTRAAVRASNRINNIILRFGHTFASKYRIRSAEGEGLLSELIEGHIPASPLVAPDGLPESVRGIVATLLADLQTHTRAAHAAQVEARTFVRAREWPTTKGPVPGQRLLEHLMSVPGVGEITALAWLAEVCDPRRFQNVKQVAAFCGCDPSLKTSAGKVTSYTRRQGNARLHYHLINAASGLIRSPREQFGELGRSIAGRHKKGGWKKACGALARRIACGLWYVHSKDEPFSYDKYKFMLIPDFRAVPIRDIVGRAPAALLAREGYHDTRQLIAAYYQGRLSLIPGFGDASLRHIRDWLREQHSKPAGLEPPQVHSPKKEAKRTYQLKPRQAYIPRPNTKRGARRS
jgi:transposase